MKEWTRRVCDVMLQKFAAPMMEMDRKHAYADSSYLMNSRMANGTAMKNPNSGGR